MKIIAETCWDFVAYKSVLKCKTPSFHFVILPESPPLFAPITDVCVVGVGVLVIISNDLFMKTRTIYLLILIRTVPVETAASNISKTIKYVQYHHHIWSSNSRYIL